MTAVRLGLTIFATDQTIDPVELAVESEQRGFSSLWFPEHTHMPTSRATPAPTGGELGPEYSRAMDPPTVLAACAAATSRIALGSASDSGGTSKRWKPTESTTRRERAREHALAMQALWADDEAEFHGRFVDLERSWSWPKPVQQPRIPTYIGGGAGPTMFEHIAEYADGWIPIGGAGIRAALPELRDAWAAAGREGRPDVIPFGALPTAEKLEYYAELGCAEVVLRIPPEPRDRVLRTLDSFAAFLPDRI